MSRKVIDCREFPGDCMLTLAGSEEELFRAGVEHMISIHGAKDTPELREQVRSAMKEEVESIA
jgi:predicted small metal-binding protein